MDKTNIQNMANVDFMKRAKVFDKAFNDLKVSTGVDVSVTLNPANWISKLLSKLHLVKIKYNLIYTDNKKID
jgi:hypothetical protein